MKKLGVAFYLVASIGCGYRYIAEFEEPTPVARLELHDANNRVLWRIDATGQAVRLSALDYGNVPAGFEQRVPSPPVRPRPLRPDEPLLLVYTTERSYVRHHGWAASDKAFVGGPWLSGPLSRATTDRIFAHEATSIRNLPDPQPPTSQ